MFSLFFFFFFFLARRVDFWTGVKLAKGKKKGTCEICFWGGEYAFGEVGGEGNPSWLWFIFIYDPNVLSCNPPPQSPPLNDLQKGEAYHFFPSQPGWGGRGEF